MTHLTGDTITVAGTEWQLSISRNMSFWHNFIGNEAYYWHFEDYGINTRMIHLALTVDGTRASLFRNSKNHEEACRVVLDSVRSADAVERLGDAYHRIADIAQRSLNVCRDDLTPTNWMSFVDGYRLVSAGLPITSVIGVSGQDALLEALVSSGRTRHEANKLLGVITYPTSRTPMFQSQADLLELGTQLQDGSITQADTESRLRAWLEQHQHIPVNFCEEPWSLTDAQEQLATATKKDCRAELDRLRSQHDQMAEAARTSLEHINDPDVSSLAYAIAEGTILNEFRKGIISKLSLGYRPIFKKIAELGGSSSWRDCFYLTYIEMTHLLEGRKVDILTLKKQRQVVATYMTLDGDQRFATSEDTKRAYEYAERVYRGSPGASDVTEIRGVAGNVGTAKGHAKIVLSSKDFDKVQEGDILVAPMTSVDYVPIMEKAAAFVTNEGGITTHAAIVAREMGKPCLLGTKIATQVLKDGDMVEVDAEQGVVRVVGKGNG